MSLLAVGVGKVLVSPKLVVVFAMGKLHQGEWSWSTSKAPVVAVVSWCRVVLLGSRKQAIFEEIVGSVARLLVV